MGGAHSCSEGSGFGSEASGQEPGRGQIIGEVWLCLGCRNEGCEVVPVCCIKRKRERTRKQVGVYLSWKLDKRHPSPASEWEECLWSGHRALWGLSETQLAFRLSTRMGGEWDACGRLTVAG